MTSPAPASPLWQIDANVIVSEMDPIVEQIESSALSSSWYLIEDDTRVHITGYYENAEEAHGALLPIEVLGCSLQDPLFQASAQKCQDTNWIESYIQSCPALTLPPFYIYGSHLKDQPKPTGMIPLWIDAATAFGSGEHHTTSGCLNALARCQKTSEQHSLRILDMGCGTGILAIAAQKLWPSAQVWAGDIDPEAVRLTRINAERNNVSLISHVCRGFQDRWVSEAAPYNLIVANILAKPLCQMAADMYQATAAGGTVILSGLITSQSLWVQNSFYTVGFRKKFILSRQGWITLALEK